VSVHTVLRTTSITLHAQTCSHFIGGQYEQSVQHVSLLNVKHFILGLKLLKIVTYLPGRPSYLTFRLTWFLIVSEPPMDLFILRITPIPVAAQSTDVGLRPLPCWDCGFESRRGHGCLSLVSVGCCQVEVSASG
jgi:hypothetical protein